MRTLLLAFGLFSLAFPISADAQRATSRGWRADVACGTDAGARRLVPPGAEGPGQPAPVPPCPTRSCVALPDGGQVCLCKGAEGEDRVRLERPGAPAREWAAPAAPLVGGPAWEAAVVDLEGDGAPETVVAQRVSVGMGLGVERWRLWMVPESPAAVPVRVDVEEYRFAGSWVRGAGDRRCRLFATRWVQGSEPGRGPGLYLQGEWLELDGARMRRATGRPVVERRYLRSLERERNARGGGAPFTWFLHPGARVQSSPRAPAFPDG